MKPIRRPPDREARATSIELFLVFVITQLSSRLAHDLTLGGAAKAGLLGSNPLGRALLRRRGARAPQNRFSVRNVIE